MSNTQLDDYSKLQKPTGKLDDYDPTDSKYNSNFGEGVPLPKEDRQWYEPLREENVGDNEKNFTVAIHNSIFQFSNMFVPKSKEIQLKEDGHGAGSIAGELVGGLINPVNLLMGGAIGEIAGVASNALTGLSRIAAVGAIEATGGLGYTLADHYQKKMSAFDDHMTTTGLVASAALGGVVGSVVHGLSHKFEDHIQIPDQSLKDLSGFIHSNPDLPLINKALIEGLDYNPVTKSGFKITNEMPEPVQTIIPLNKENIYDRLKIKSDSSAAIDDAVHIQRAADLESRGIGLKDIDNHIEYSKNEFDARYSQMLEDSDHDTVTHLMDPKNEVNVRRALHGEEADEMSQKAAKLYNDMNSKAIEEARAAGIDMGQIEGYVKQIHDSDRLRSVANPQDWIDFIKPRLVNDIDDNGLRSVYENIIGNDTSAMIKTQVTQKSSKARVLEFKDAKSAMEYEDMFGYKKLVGSHMVDNLNGLRDQIAQHRVIGSDNPIVTLKYLGQLNGMTKKEVTAALSAINNEGSAPLPNLISKAVNFTLTGSRLLNAFAKPLGTLVTKLPLDFATATAQSMGKYGMGNTLKGIISKKPSEDIAYLANLPYEQKETFKNILGGFKESSRVDHIEILGGKVTDKTNNTLRISQRLYLKIGGMHMLDTMTRKYALKIANTAIKAEYAANGLENLLPKADKNILKLALNSSGELVPSKLDILANNTTDVAMQHQYRDVANRLKTLYAKSINDCNPIYSTVGKQFSKYDPTVAAGARSVMWVVRMYHATYKDTLEHVVRGNGKLKAGATLAAMSAGLTAVEMGWNHVVNSVMGNEDHKESTGSTNIDALINSMVEDGMSRDFTKAYIKNITTFSAMFNAPIWYGSGAKGLRAAVYTMTGDEDKAAENAKKAIPMIGAITNAWSYINE